MKVGQVYKVTYTNRFGTSTFIGQYKGIINGDEAEYNECELCYEEHDKLHEFDIPLDETGSNEDIIQRVECYEYEPLYFGIDCIKKCTVEER